MFLVCVKYIGLNSQMVELDISLTVLVFLSLPDSVNLRSFTFLETLTVYLHFQPLTCEAGRRLT